MLPLKNIIKEICPFIVYKYIEKRRHLRKFAGIDLTNKFSGKIFCIGFNKTGTTSIEQALHDFGYHLGSQAVAEMLLADWYNRDYSRIIRFCQAYQAFQDIPFSLPQTYSYLDEAFPEAKFILTVRDSKDQWYESLVRFHTKLFSSDKSRPPDRGDLENALYRYKGFGLDVMKMVYAYPEVDLYAYEYYTKLYEDHNKGAIQYFQDRPQKLLVLNVSEARAYQRLAAFLQITVHEDMMFPWKNIT